MRARSFYIETWKSTIHMLCPATPADVKKFLKRRLNEECELNDDWEGVCVDTRGGGTVVALEKWRRSSPDSVSVLAHECHHAASVILARRGIKHCDETAEVFAYLSEEIMRRCMKLLNKK